MARTDYVGKAGELAAMSEFLLLEYNVAIPQVDTGDDVWVILDKRGTVWGVQVKTATGERRRYGYSGQFLVPLKQLQKRGDPPRIFVLALRAAFGQWDFLVIPQRVLRREQQSHGIGSLTPDGVQFYVAFQEEEAICSGRSWQRYRNNFHLESYR